MVRLRLPGGRVSASTLVRLVELATAYGNGIVQLTSRAGLQLRGLADPLPGAFVAAVAATGLLPSTTHERVRNIVASPLTGLHGGLANVSGLTRALDLGLTSEPTLADLPGRFLFVLDDGRGDVIDLRFDLAYQAAGPDRGHVLAGSSHYGVAVTTAEAVPTLLRLTHAFADARRTTRAWHVAELPDLPGWADQLGLRPVPGTHGSVGVPLGRLGHVASVAVPLARLTTAHAEAVAEVATADIVITPWRGLVIPGGADRLDHLAASGLVIDDDAAWAQLSACVGLPACAKSRIDTVTAAEALVATGRPLPRTHLAGCERRCGAPTEEHYDLVAPTMAEALAVVTGRRQPVGPRQ